VEEFLEGWTNQKFEKQMEIKTKFKQMAALVAKGKDEQKKEAKMKEFEEKQKADLEALN